jgi:glutamate carboxypeptidase
MNIIPVAARSFGGKMTCPSKPTGRNGKIPTKRRKLRHMTADASAIRDWILGQQDNMVALLETLVNIDSGSYDKSGVDAVGAQLSSFLQEIGIETSVQPVERFGDTLFAGTAAVRRDGTRHNFLLMGHRDTVFDKGDASRRPFRIEAGRAYGPGVADMKAGLVMNAFILAAYQRLAPEIPVAFLMTGDEEIGSQASLDHIREEALNAKAVFNAEPARASGNFVSGRKGGFTYHIEIKGKAAHAGVNYTQGVSAIGELAHKITALHSLSDVENGITLNVGIISGGTTANTVAARAMAKLDVRFANNEQRGRLIDAIDGILMRAVIPHTQTTFSRESESLPLAPNAENTHLSELYRETALELGVDVIGEYTGGCADSGITASMGAPTVCGTGPVGGNAHTEDEYIIVETLSQRAAMVALSIKKLVDL